VARNQDIPVAILAELAVERKKEIIADNVEDVSHKKYEHANNVPITKEEIEFQKNRVSF